MVYSIYLSLGKGAAYCIFTSVWVKELPIWYIYLSLGKGAAYAISTCYICKGSAYESFTSAVNSPLLSR